MEDAVPSTLYDDTPRAPWGVSSRQTTPNLTHGSADSTKQKDGSAGDYDEHRTAPTGCALSTACRKHLEHSETSSQVSSARKSPSPTPPPSQPTVFVTTCQSASSKASATSSRRRAETAFCPRPLLAAATAVPPPPATLSGLHSAQHHTPLMSSSSSGSHIGSSLGQARKTAAKPSKSLVPASSRSSAFSVVPQDDVAASYENIITKHPAASSSRPIEINREPLELATEPSVLHDVLQSRRGLVSQETAALLSSARASHASVDFSDPGDECGEAYEAYHHAASKSATSSTVAATTTQRLAELARTVATLSLQLRQKQQELGVCTEELHAAQAHIRQVKEAHDAALAAAKHRTLQLEGRLRVALQDADASKASCRDLEEKLLHETEQHRTSMVLLHLAEKEVSVARQSADAAVRSLETEKTKLQDRVAALTRQVEHGLRASAELNSTAAHVSAEDKVTPRDLPSLSASPTPQQSASPGSPVARESGPSTAGTVGGFPAAKHRSSMVALTPPASLAQVNSSQFRRQDSSSGGSSVSVVQQLRHQVAALQSQIHDKNTQLEAVTSTLETALRDKEILEDALHKQDTAKHRRLSDLEAEVRCAKMRERQLKEQLDDERATYELELSSLTANLTRWRQQQAEDTSRARSLSLGHNRQHQQHLFLNHQMSPSHGRHEPSSSTDVVTCSQQVSRHPHSPPNASAASTRLSSPVPCVSHDSSEQTSLQLNTAGASSNVLSSMNLSPRSAAGGDATFPTDQTSSAPVPHHMRAMSSERILADLTSNVANKNAMIADLQQQLVEAREKISLLEESRRGLLLDVSVLRQRLSKQQRHTANEESSAQSAEPVDDRDGLLYSEQHSARTVASGPMQTSDAAVSRRAVGLTDENDAEDADDLFTHMHKMTRMENELRALRQVILGESAPAANRGSARTSSSRCDPPGDGTGGIVLDLTRSIKRLCGASVDHVRSIALSSQSGSVGAAVAVATGFVLTGAVIGIGVTQRR